MEKILVFGGTFDPPHQGHRHLLKEALKQASFDKVLLIPAFIPPHKSHVPALSFEARCAVLADYFREISDLEISDLEQKREGKSYTIDTVAALKEEKKGAEIYLLIGSDMFLSFETWREYERLLEEICLVVGSREKGDYERLLAHKKHLESSYKCKGIFLCKMEALECASSDLRSKGDGLAERALSHISKELDLSRARHTMQVAEYARYLAEKWGADPEKAWLAGLLHDCTKCRDHAWHIEYLRKHGFALSDADLAAPQILHQYSGAIFAKEELLAKDSEILSAIACHTTGKEGMSLLDQILFFADSCEPSRDYPDAARLRAIGEESLKKGVLALLEHTAAYVKSKNLSLHPRSEAARMSILKELK